MSRGGKREGAGRRRQREEAAQQQFDQVRGPGRTHGLVFSYSLDEYEYDFLKAGIRIDGREPTDALVRARAKALTREALSGEMQRILQHPDLPKQFLAGSENSAENT